MARSTNAMVTFNDLSYMVSNNGFRSKMSIPSSNECVTKSELYSYLYAFISDEGSRSSNQLVPYQKISRGLYVSAASTINTAYSGQTFTFDLEVSGLWSISDNASWITVSPSSGEDNQSSISVILSQNEGLGSRTGVITVSAENGQSYTITITQAANPGTATDPITLGFGNPDSEDACLDYSSSPSTYYVEDGKTFYNSLYLYANSTGTIKASAGWYSDGVNARYWTGTSFTAQTPCLEP